MGSGGSLRDWKKSLLSVFKSKVIAIFDFRSRTSEHSKFTFLLKLLSDVKGSHGTNTRNRKVARPSRSSQPRSQEIFDRHTFSKTLFSKQRTHFQAINQMPNVKNKLKTSPNPIRMHFRRPRYSCDSWLSILQTQT